MNCKTVGIIGGGQLGMMLADAIHKLGGKVVGLDPSDQAPLKLIADQFICAEFDDLKSLELLAKNSDVITYEFENIKSEYLIQLNEKYNLKQGIKQLFDSQDRLREKENANKCGLKTAKFYNCETKEDLEKGVKKLGYPCLYKTRTLGYDGHGQVLLNSDEDLKKVSEYLSQEGILEEYLNFDYEASVILVKKGEEVYTLPITKNIHKQGILDVVVAPLEATDELLTKMKKASIEFVTKANYEGILCIEYFVKGNEFYFNEMAPRPHNSGHYSIEALDISQYELFARYLLDLPMSNPKLVKPAIMKNILGKDMWMVPKLGTLPNSHVHMYNKSEVRAKRKMGHVTILDMNLEEYINVEKNM